MPKVRFRPKLRNLLSVIHYKLLWSANFFQRGPEVIRILPPDSLWPPAWVSRNLLETNMHFGVHKDRKSNKSATFTNSHPRLPLLNNFVITRSSLSFWCRRRPCHTADDVGTRPLGSHWAPWEGTRPAGGSLVGERPWLGHHLPEMQHSIKNRDWAPKKIKHSLNSQVRTTNTWAQVNSLNFTAQLRLSTRKYNDTLMIIPLMHSTSVSTFYSKQSTVHGVW